MEQDVLVEAHPLGLDHHEEVERFAEPYARRDRGRFRREIVVEFVGHGVPRRTGGIGPAVSPWSLDPAGLAGNAGHGLGGAWTIALRNLRPGGVSSSMDVGSR